MYSGQEAENLEAADYDQAVELSRDCPHLKFGGWIEVRQVDVT